ncbi:hypothetical protein H4219_004934 [Mycoemilia scoparia]|uniref:OPT family small oligopeptide transporter n=1 Tax=Mycoemilia scoparia TaxID=417184 RepID=A0A9W7ZQW4_9FUNG|nr:hypothetical protein H4219_004934 [Mycoemilia scoparia]
MAVTDQTTPRDGQSEKDAEVTRSFEGSSLYEQEKGGLDKKPSFNSELSDDSPIEEVRAAVPPTDDASLPTATFRAWSLGILFTLAVSFVNQFFWFRAQPLTIGVLVVELLSFPLGKFMARVLPTKVFRFWRWSFTLNPGPFNIKEHALISIIASSAATTAMGIDIIVIQRLYFNVYFGFGGALLLVLSSQIMGYGFAGLLRRFLVTPSSMIWPVNLVTCTVFNTLHQRSTKAVDEAAAVEANSKWAKISRERFFLFVAVASFTYYWLPGLMFPLLTSISWLCWISRDNITLNQVGSGLKGMGIAAFTLDWNTIVAFLPTPLSIPVWTHLNMLAGFVTFIWVLVPAFYWTNTYNGKKFPFYNTKLYDKYGDEYNTSRVLYANNTLNIQAYNEYSPVYQTAFFAICYGQGLAALGAIISHTGLYHGKDIWRRLRNVRSLPMDIHARLMQSYREVPDWWYFALLVIAFAVSMVTVCVFPTDLPWWGLVLAVVMAAGFVLPLGLVMAITSQNPSISMITEWVMGAILPGRPVANLVFKNYGTVTVQQALALVQDLKLGHYMKIPPRELFVFQVVGTILAGIVNLATSQYLLTNIDNICTDKAYPWTCPNAGIWGAGSIIWGVVGPRKYFAPDSIYHSIPYFLLIGFLIPIPVYFLYRWKPNSWLKYIHLPVFMLGPLPYPPAPTVELPCWVAVGVFFNGYIKRYHNAWWRRFNYVLSAGLDSGIAIAAIVIFFAIQNNNISFPTWWGNNPDSIDQCPSAIKAAP